jgi:spore maturation protein CgeB
MTAAGSRIVLVAKFNDRYHRTGGAIERALTAAGADVARCEERDRLADRLLGRTLPERLAALARRHRPDLILVFKGASLTPAAVDMVRPAAPGAIWVNWFPDSPHLLDLSLRNGAAYDWCFIFDTSMVAAHHAAGRRAEYLAEGCEPEYHRPLPDARWPRVPIAFVGSREPRREAALAGLADLGLTVWGPQWPRGPLYGDDFVRAFSNAAVALNVHQFFDDIPDPRYGTGANRRVFELAAIGTVQLCDAKADVARNFRPDHEIILFSTHAQLRERAVALLADPRECEAVAARARTRALAEHTWGHRLTDLFAMVAR